MSIRPPTRGSSHSRASATPQPITRALAYADAEHQPEAGRPYERRLQRLARERGGQPAVGEDHANEMVGRASA